MGDWYCYKCKEQLVEQEIWIHIGDLDRPVDGYVCPSCKAIWANEEGVSRLREAEEALEDK